MDNIISQSITFIKELYAYNKFNNTKDNFMRYIWNHLYFDTRVLSFGAEPDSYESTLVDLRQLCLDVNKIMRVNAKSRMFFIESLNSEYDMMREVNRVIKREYEPINHPVLQPTIHKIKVGFEKALAQYYNDNPKTIEL